MDVATTTMESNGNMIIKQIRRFNAAVIHYIMTIRFRAMGATILGGFAGLSLTTTIIPTALTTILGLDTFAGRWGLSGYAVYSMMAWGVGGWAVQKTGSKWLGAIILGMVGLVTGALFTAVGLGSESDLLLTGGGAGLLYGAVGGLIVGDALRSPPSDPNLPDDYSGCIGGLGIFSYFTKKE